MSAVATLASVEDRARPVLLRTHAKADRAAARRSARSA